MEMLESDEITYCQHSARCLVHSRYSVVSPYAHRSLKIPVRGCECLEKPLRACVPVLSWAPQGRFRFSFVGLSKE